MRLRISPWLWFSIPKFPAHYSEVVILLTRHSAYLFILPLVLFVLATAIACAPANQPASGHASTAGAGAPPAPTDVALSVEPGTTTIIANWTPAADADSYNVRWRHKGADFKDNASASTTESDAEFEVGSQGLWIVRVVACNASGCSDPATSSAPVIISILGHQAVRAWYTDAGIHLDWDPFPGGYVVKYRLSTDASMWKSSTMLSENGFTITGDDLTDFEGIGSPIVRVHFNGDTNGENCTLLGRYPNQDMQELSRFANPGAPERTTVARGGRSTPNELPDPVTRILRPVGDFTVTYKTVEGYDDPFRCLERDADNAWERNFFGDTVKKCSGSQSEILDHYVYEPNTTFPDGAICGTRKPKTDYERDQFGEEVRVCNRHPDPDDDQQDSPSSTDPSTRTHTADPARPVLMYADPSDNGLEHPFLRNFNHRTFYSVDDWYDAVSSIAPAPDPEAQQPLF